MSELLNLVRYTLDEKLAENIVTIDIRNVNAYTDYYVICTAKNPRHANSLVEFVEKEVTKNEQCNKYEDVLMTSSFQTKVVS